MKNIINGAFITIVVSVAMVQAQDIREENLKKAEIEMSVLLMERIINHPWIVDDRVSWLDGGRAATEKNEITQDVYDFKKLLASVVELVQSKKITSFDQLPAVTKGSINDAVSEILVAIEALPSMHKKLKSDLLKKLELVIGKSEGNYVENVTKLMQGMDELIAKYERQIPAFRYQTPVYETVKLEAIIIYAIDASLPEIINKYGLTDSEVEFMLDDMSNYEGGFKEWEIVLRRKFGYHYYNIDVFELWDRGFQHVVNLTAQYLGYNYDLENRPTKGRIDKEGFRVEDLKEQSGVKLEVSERLARLRAAVTNLKH